ncbi:MAG: ABC transporter permease [Ruminococcus sp.]|nr:ABC transporter permease [Ruminococcus sp.]
MLFKLSLCNIRKSIRDYAIYFFTLVIGVAVFYVFNAVGSQAVYMQVTENRNDIIELMSNTLSAISVFVSVVLGLLIVYASRFLMKRRNMEFALYLILGMGKRKISAIMLIETIIIGLGSLVTGLIAGIGLSQLMSALVANLFEADMTAYKFSVSTESIFKTIICFAVIYLVVMLFNSIIISKFKLIDLIQSGKKTEKVKLKNPVLCVLIFIIAASALGFTYYQVSYNYNQISQNELLLYIASGMITTFFIFWSISGLLLRIIMSMKGLYYKNLNSFTFRQISSKVNTTVMSMSIICIMLFVTICTLSSAFSIRNSMNAGLNEFCPADFEVEYIKYPDDEYEKTIAVDIIEIYKKYGYNITENIENSVHFSSYTDEHFTFASALGDNYEKVKEKVPMADFDVNELIVKISDYNNLMELYGRKPLSIQSDEFIIVCNYKSIKEIRDEYLTAGYKINVFGHTLKSKYDECQDGFINISSQPINVGIYIVPDDIIDEQCVNSDFLIGNYSATSKDEKNRIESEFIGKFNNVMNMSSKDAVNRQYYNVNTRISIAEATIGLGAMITFIGLYIGLIFLISCAAIISLKQLSDSVDSISRYEILRKIGVKESSISRSLFYQTGIFFLLPLLLACIHSIFGMKFSMIILEVFGTQKLTESIVLTSVFILLIYGGYFLITYFCSKGIIRKK